MADDTLAALSARWREYVARKKYTSGAGFPEAGIYQRCADELDAARAELLVPLRAAIAAYDATFPLGSWHEEELAVTDHVIKAARALVGEVEK